MERNEMLEKLGTTPDEFASYSNKVSEFIAGLNPGELALHTKMQPPTKPTQLLGPAVTAQDLTQLVREGSPLGTILSNWHPGQPGGPGDGGI